MVSIHSRKPHVAVVGGGWAGFGAVKTLCESGFKVTLLDAIPDPTGRTPYLSPSKKPIEAGFKGFWKDYPNIENMVKELGLQENKIFTDYTNSSFYSPFGLEATAPVFSKTTFPQLPSPIGQIAASAALFERLPLQDRASMVGLLYAMLDLYRDEETYAAYDRMTAHELFIKMKLSKRLVDDFIRPTLLIGLFKAPEELSAAVSMELLYFYALAHQNSFDVRWIKQSSISSAIFSPLCTYLESKYDLEIKGGCRVSGLEIDDSKASATSVKSLRYSQSQNQESTLSDIDGVILALGSKGLSNVMRGSPSLAVRSPELTAAASLGSIDVISCRLWLDTIVPTRTPANVFSRFDELRGAGGTFFMLDQLQGESDGVGMDGLWGGDNSTRGSVVAVDFYNAGALLPLSDKDLIATIIEKLLPGAVPKFREAKVVDSWVQRFPGAVSWFSPGSYTKRPCTVVDGVDNLFCAGDWVIMGSREGIRDASRQKTGDPGVISSSVFPEEHGAKGLCQERALVSGIHAANQMIKQIDAIPSSSATLKYGKIIPVRKDELQVVIGKTVNQKAASLLKKVGISSFWLR